MPAPTKLLTIMILGIVFFSSSQPSVAQRLANTASARITVTLSPDIAEASVSGRLLVLFSKKNPSPIKGPNWFAPEEFTGADVTDFEPGDSIEIPLDADAFPQSLTRLKTGNYFVQAVLRRNPDFAHHKDGVGNLASSSKKVALIGGDNPIKLTLDRAIAAKPLSDTPTRKVFSMRSELLSEFHNRDVVERALVLLPSSYLTDANKRYPVYYEVTGFGGTIDDLIKRHQRSRIASDGIEFIHVFLTGQTQWGHHVYANSATNGPRGDALVKELIPAIDSNFRTVAEPYGRMLGGHSSGGWSSLWLQTHYPKFFGGVWSTAPDPVDFRDWQGVNIYQPKASLFVSPAGEPRPLAVINGQTFIWYQKFSEMDDVLERGGQLRSFEAVFSPRGDDGQPLKCWDRVTGEVDPEIVKYWRRYDISDYLASNWESLKDDLEGKIHVYAGQEDTFLLAEAVVLLKQRLQDLSSDAQVEIIAQKDHFTLLDETLRNRINQGMAQKFRQGARR